MSKIKIDTDKINNTLLPVAKNSYNQAVSARNFASKVSFPYGEYNWNSVYNQIDDCVDEINDYIKWINSINKGIITAIGSNLEDITTIEVQTIQTQ